MSLQQSQRPTSCPSPSKYSLVDFGVVVCGQATKLIPNCVDAVAVFGVARMSAMTLERMLVAAVCDVALRFVCTPIGIKPSTAIKQKAAIPRARVNSTSENADVEAIERFTFDRF